MKTGPMPGLLFLTIELLALLWFTNVKPQKMRTALQAQHDGQAACWTGQHVRHRMPDMVHVSWLTLAVVVCKGTMQHSQ
jgi:hypothetical protein